MSKKKIARIGAAFLAAVLLLTSTVTTVFAAGGDPAKVSVTSKDVIVKVCFVDENGETVKGGDMFLTEGNHNYSELELPEGYELVTTGDFFVEEGAKIVVKVKKIATGTVINVVYKSEGGKNLGGGDFVVDKDGDGIANYSELPLPEGYELIVTGDFFVEEGKSYTITLKKIVEGTIINVQCVDADTE